MATDRRGGETQSLRELGRGRRPVLQNGAGDPLAGGGVGIRRDIRGFHNTIVRLFDLPIQIRPALATGGVLIGGSRSSRQ